MHKALRRELGIENSPGARRFPFNNRSAGRSACHALRQLANISLLPALVDSHDIDEVVGMLHLRRAARFLSRDAAASSPSAPASRFRLRPA